MKKVEKFESKDGKIFNSQKECEDYEKVENFFKPFSDKYFHSLGINAFFIRHFFKENFEYFKEKFRELLIQEESENKNV